MKNLKQTIQLALFSLLVPVIVLAQQIIPINQTTLPGNQSSTFTTVFNYYIKVFLGVVGVLAVAFLIYGGFRYITSAGNEEQAESAKKIIQNSIIGLIIIILSYVIVIVIGNALLPGGRGI
ncbi:MAG: hypothetical protein A3B10_02810 [Candidatus Doudnabacteria bacterium RIFCSPLOWO2_01_FULL_44_21]|uniref:Uncharacterized protein n=1 Tax=Candidatus Doudnabacteria bacterium RIFCSPLOWO2_01_FULL_44_21 TaxID=1817841 RepID=A0A1F5Q265_9BACT|nr:MAG: hypothetical protein A3B95_03080 [Candidatus Doudnabacteria bacterium RIFCSPHIGHO2_02_FULL_43_13b]OGE96218.1 MAG: hypothetical protein A3B10_02810 [Candidatus Doudnabacteria bacterium RIFCSPLOWO2_01_FULL_44_21]